jgi:hypothetical protein
MTERTEVIARLERALATVQRLPQDELGPLEEQISRLIALVRRGVSEEVEVEVLEKCAKGLVASLDLSNQLRKRREEGKTNSSPAIKC